MSSPSCVLDDILHRAVQALPFPPPCVNCPRRTLVLLENLLDVGANRTGIQTVLQGKVGRKVWVCGVSLFFFYLKKKRRHV